MTILSNRQLAAAIVYNRQPARRALSDAQQAILVATYQRASGLDVDGKLGPLTAQELDDEARTTAIGVRCWPLRTLADGRQPQITSGHSSVNPDRPAHHGCDLFYRRAPGDPPVKRGDGGGAGSNPDGSVKWWIPPGTIAVAAAAGLVVVAGPSATGFRVWIDHGTEMTGYFHLRSCLVAAGDDIDAGHELGTVGDNPADTDAAHLHFELYRGGLQQYPRGSVNPEPWLTTAAHLPGV